MRTRHRPGWATRLPSTDYSRRLVTCPTCRRVLTWSEFLQHGPTCTEDKLED